MAKKRGMTTRIDIAVFNEGFAVTTEVYENEYTDNKNAKAVADLAGVLEVVIASIVNNEVITAKDKAEELKEKENNFI